MQKQSGRPVRLHTPVQRNFRCQPPAPGDPVSRDKLHPGRPGPLRPEETNTFNKVLPAFFIGGKCARKKAVSNAPMDGAARRDHGVPCSLSLKILSFEMGIYDTIPTWIITI